MDSQILHEISGLLNIPIVMVQSTLKSVVSKTLWNDEKEPQGVVVDFTGGLRIDGIAGVLSIFDEIEIEIIPKFLSTKSTTWRQDFLYLAFISNSGALAEKNLIASEYVSNETLLTLTARVFEKLLSSSPRNLVRRYASQDFIDWTITGHANWSEYIEGVSEGIPQSQTLFTKKNVVNSEISWALEKLIDVLGVGELSARLNRHKLIFGQPFLHPIGRQQSHLKGRERSWEPIYELARNINRNLYVSGNTGRSVNFSFLVKTWQLWEDFLEALLTRGNFVIEKKLQYFFGSNNLGQKQRVIPDFSFLFGRQTIPIDAKYKKTDAGATSSDLYEMFAFLNSTGSNLGFLVYPNDQSDDSSSGIPCKPSLFQTMCILNSHQVALIRVEVNGISKEGLDMGASTFWDDFADIADDLSKTTRNSLHRSS